VVKNASVLRIRQVRSRIGQTLRQREALRTLGLHRIGQVVERPDNPAVRGTVRAIGHLVRIEGPDLPQEEPKLKQTSIAAVKESGKPDKATSAAEAPSAPKTTKKKSAKKKTTKKKTTKKKSTKKKSTKKKTTKKKSTKKKTTKKKSSGGKS
jgi:ribosomal protein L30